MKQLVACWRDPGPLPDDVVVLSFLGPAEHDVLQRRHRGEVLAAREVSAAVRPATRALYVDIVADAGIALRQRVGMIAGISRWWFHPVSFRDCESDPSYDDLIAVETIRTFGADSIQLIRPPGPIGDVLAALGNVTMIDRSAAGGRSGTWLRGIASRTRMLLREMRHARAARTLPNDTRFEVALSAFWDWSVSVEASDGSLADRYFRQLETQLVSIGSTVGTLAWLDPGTEPGKSHRALRAVIEPLRGRTDVALLQRELHIADIIGALADFGPLMAYRRARVTKPFRAAFVRHGLDYLPLFASQLERGFAGAAIANCELVVKATQRALARHKSTSLISFLEHFPHARAQYAAARAGQVTSWVTQHASYCHEKTFLVLDPKRESDGAPDGLSCPRPDFVCAAGELGRSLFIESGYRSEQVAVTGSPRYDHIIVSESRVPAVQTQRTILVAASIAVDVELDMLEAIGAATMSHEDVSVVLRNHPFRRLDREPRFAPYRHRIRVSNGSLKDDLKAADVVLFSYSTVAEEAFLQGIPVWQWLPPGFNGSALAEVWSIPRFSTIAELRNAVAGEIIAPSNEAQAAVARALFGPCDGRAAERVAHSIVQKGFVNG